MSGNAMISCPISPCRVRLLTNPIFFDHPFTHTAWFESKNATPHALMRTGPCAICGGLVAPSGCRLETALLR